MDAHALNIIVAALVLMIAGLVIARRMTRKTDRVGKRRKEIIERMRHRSDYSEPDNDSQLEQRSRDGA